MGRRGVITKAGKSVLNPTDAYRKEIRRKELKKNAKERKRTRELVVLRGDPEKLREEIKKLKALGPKAKEGLKMKRKQLEDMEQRMLKQQKLDEESARVAAAQPAAPLGFPPPAAPPVMTHQLGPPPPMPGKGADADDNDDDDEESEEDEDDLDEHIVPPPPGAPPGFIPPPPPGMMMMHGAGLPPLGPPPGAMPYGWMGAPPLPPPLPPGLAPPPPPLPLLLEADRVLKAEPQVNLPTPKPKVVEVIQAEPVMRSNPALLLSMVPAAVIRQRQQAQLAAQREKDSQSMSRVQRLATPKESKTLASLQTPSLAPRAALKPSVSAARPPMTVRRTNLAPDVDTTGTPLPLPDRPAPLPLPGKAPSLFFSATSHPLSSVPARKEDTFTDFMKDLQTLGAFDG